MAQKGSRIYVIVPRLKATMEASTTIRTVAPCRRDGLMGITSALAALKRHAVSGEVRAIGYVCRNGSVLAPALGALKERKGVEISSFLPVEARNSRIAVRTYVPRRHAASRMA